MPGQTSQPKQPLAGLCLCQPRALTCPLPAQAATPSSMPAALPFTQAGVTAGGRTLPERPASMSALAGGIPSQANGAHITTTWLIN
ncbi:MAG: hypothetical protein AB1607_17650 [Chloroflexota bacterium]